LSTVLYFPEHATSMALYSSSLVVTRGAVSTDFVCTWQRTVQHDQVSTPCTDGRLDGRPRCRRTRLWTW